MLDLENDISTVWTIASLYWYVHYLFLKKIQLVGICFYLAQLVVEIKNIAKYVAA